MDVKFDMSRGVIFGMNEGFFMGRFLWVTLVCAAVAGLGCNEDAQRASDCSSHEYFVEGRERCVPCPLLVEPTCRVGCGFSISADENGCSVASCNLECQQCAEGTFFSERTWACETCPESDLQNCDDLPCQCQLLRGNDVCSTAYCGRCEEPPENWRVLRGQCLQD